MGQRYSKHVKRQVCRCSPELHLGSEGGAAAQAEEEQRLCPLLYSIHYLVCSHVLGHGRDYTSYMNKMLPEDVKTNMCSIYKTTNNVNKPIMQTLTTLMYEI